MDNVDEKFANVVDYDAFSVRIAEADIDKVRGAVDPTAGFHPRSRTRAALRVYPMLMAALLAVLWTLQ